MKVDIISTDGKTTGRSVDLPAAVFGIEPNEHAVYLAVKAYNAAQRQGTHKSKEKGEIKASTRKIKKQKGTGTARAGSLKSGLFRGGGRMFGPRPRKYNIKLNKKVKSLARNSAFSSKAKESKIRVIEDFSFDAPKTKAFKDVLKGLDVANSKSIFIIGDADKNVLLSSRNLKEAKVVNIAELNTVDILHANTVILSESAVNKLKASNS
ncbi:UNVERIFIED_CONTAM: hypothetical protein GTU68_047057 [Idotea baltica]|nr:hypothetical protein [Idotea baltica]